MELIEAILELLQVHAIVSFCTTYVAVPCHILYFSNVDLLEPFGYDHVADAFGRMNTWILFLDF